MSAKRAEEQDSTRHIWYCGIRCSTRQTKHEYLTLHQSTFCFLARRYGSLAKSNLYSRTILHLSRPCIQCVTRERLACNVCRNLLVTVNCKIANDVAIQYCKQRPSKKRRPKPTPHYQERSLRGGKTRAIFRVTVPTMAYVAIVLLYFLLEQHLGWCLAESSTKNKMESM